MIPKKFRAWDKVRKEMTYDNQYITTVILSDAFESRKDQFIVMQSTGIKDQNGSLIYEHDIVEWTQYGSSMTLVDYDDIVESDDMTAPGSGFQFNQYPSKGTVVGNIYENPNLFH